ncbi:MAG: PepSY domain-containing protein [Janthinobacterium lividum]
MPSGADFDVRTHRARCRWATRSVQALLAFMNLHFGRYGDWPIQLFYCFGGLVTGLLPLTSWLLWQEKRRAKKRRVMATSS